MVRANENRANAAGDGRSLRVLVAEDNEVNSALAARLLARRGHHAVVVGTGSEAIAAWEKGAFDLILMDLQMLQMDGLTATVAIRNREKTSTTYTPIIALTANAASADEARCRAAGMDAFISKPVRIDAFYAVIASVLERRPGTSSALPADAPEAARGGEFDLQAALEAVDGERELLHGMIAIFMRQTPLALQDIDAAIERGDAAALESAAHKLKGSIAIFGARSACEAAQHLEDLASSGNLPAAGAARLRLGDEIARLRSALDAVAAGSMR
jgi:CheY-like chemotaxis protein/HPt (histidine-containing phosphotransfer) domain-containing protein